MGILIPTETLTGPQSGLMGAATGLFQGLAQGIPIAEQMQQRRQESERQNTELAIQAGQVLRKNKREDASKRAAQALLRASMMNAGAASNGFGGQSPPGASAGSAAPALPNEIGPGVAGGTITGPVEHPDYTGEGPSPNPQQQSTGNPGTDWLAGEMSSGSLRDLSPEDADRIIEAHTRDLHLNAITQHAGRISNTIQRGLDKGAYDAVDEDGHPDPSARIQMEGLQRQIQSLDRTDPRAAAALLDKAEEIESSARQYKAHQEAGFARRQNMLQGFQADLQNRAAMPRTPGKPDVASNEMSHMLSLWNNHVITDEQMAKFWPMAVDGTLEMNRQMEQLKFENEVLKNQATTQAITESRNKAYWDTPEGRAKMQELIGGRQVRVQEARNEGKAETGSAKPLSSDRQYEKAHTLAEKDYSTRLEDLANDTDAQDEFRKKHDEFVADRENEHLRRMQTKPATAGSSFFDATSNGTVEEQPAGPSGPASVLWRLFKKGRIGKDELKRRAEKAGLTPDDFKAFTGAK